MRIELSKGHYWGLVALRFVGIPVIGCLIALVLM